ncbi:major facilitator superfamily domain-containing protein, partial [Endogone sp. FLAS-F59071]
LRHLANHAAARTGDSHNFKTAQPFLTPYNSSPPPLRPPEMPPRNSQPTTPLLHSGDSQSLRYHATSLLSHDRAVHESDEEMSTWRMLLLTTCMIGVQFTWTVELSYGNPYLLSLDIPKALTPLVWLAGPLSGLIIQPLIGALSDKSTSRFGRRRPYIVTSAALVCLATIGVAYAHELAEGWVNYGTKATYETLDARENELKNVTIAIAVISFYFLDFSLNAVQACCRALILDIPPLRQQEIANAWAGRLSNLTMVVGYFVGNLDLVHHLPWLGNTQMKALCNLSMLVLLTTLTITCLTTKERPYVEVHMELRRGRLLIMVFTLPALLLMTFSIQALVPHLRLHPARVSSPPRHCTEAVQYAVFCVDGLVPILVLQRVLVITLESSSLISSSTSYVSEIYFEDKDGSWEEGTRAGSFAMLCYAIVSAIAGVTLPLLTPTTDGPAWRSPFTTKNIFTASLIIFAFAMLSTFFVSTVEGATLALATLGISWAVATWVPFTIVGEFVASEEERKLEESTNVRPARSRDLLSPASDEEELGEGSSSSSPAPAPAPATTAGSVLEAQQRPEEDFDAGMILGVHNMYVVFPQFAVALIAAGIFKLVEKVQPDGGLLVLFGGGAPPEIPSNKPEGVAWVLRFGGLMALVAAWLSRYIVEIKIPREGERGREKRREENRVGQGKGKGKGAETEARTVDLL